MEGKQNILCVGLACVDIVSTCESFPIEDSDQRCLEQRWSRGGNASNTASVISLLPTNCTGHFIGSFANSHELGFVTDDLKANGVSYMSCVTFDDCHCPVSIVLVNQQNGSRTIVHSNKNLPELSLDHLLSVDIEKNSYTWVHLEGRPNVEAQIAFLQRIDKWNETAPEGQRIVTSVELEKNRNDLVELLDKADYVFVSKEHAQFRGYNSKEEAVTNLVKGCREGASIICPWGEEGAVAIKKASSAPNPQILRASIYPPAKVVDTLAAGDSFIAGTISALSHGYTLEKAIDYGCRVAGTKCGMIGLRGLRHCDELRL